MSRVFLPVLQTYTAVYYVIADLVMLAMYLYYKIRNRMVESEWGYFVFLSCLFYYLIFQMPNIRTEFLFCAV